MRLSHLPDGSLGLPSQEVNVKGSDIASRSGFAPVGLAAKPSGELALRTFQPGGTSAQQIGDAGCRLCGHEFS